MQKTDFAQPDWPVRKNRPHNGTGKNGPSSTSGWHDAGLPVMLSTPSQQQSCRKDAIGSAMLIYVMTTADKVVNG